MIATLAAALPASTDVFGTVDGLTSSAEGSINGMAVLFALIGAGFCVSWGSKATVPRLILGLIVAALIYVLFSNPTLLGDRFKNTLENAGPATVQQSPPPGALLAAGLPVSASSGSIAADLAAAVPAVVGTGSA